jgi:hypothetical protein
MSKLSKGVYVASEMLNRNVEIKDLDGVDKSVKRAKQWLNDEKANTGMRAEQEVVSVLSKSAQNMIEHSNRYRKSFAEMASLQVQIIEESKELTKKSKDYANQVGEALARIDKVLVKDFEAKLLLLERFVIASKEIAELEKNGALQKIASSFVK